jgi:hypothetical protein
MARVSRKSVREALAAHGGNITRVADAMNVSRKTVYNWIEQYDLRDDLQVSRDEMRDIAERNVFLAVQSGDLDTSKFVLTHMPSSQPRWSSRSEVTGADGAALIPPDVADAIKQSGLDVREVLVRFVEIIRERQDGQA